MIQYELDSTYKVVQEEWARIEGMIQSEFERIIQGTHAVEKAAQEAFILAERTETWGCSQWVKAMTSMLKGTIQNSRIEDSVSWTASTHQSHHRSSPFPHTSSEFWKQEQLWLSTFDKCLTLKRTTVPEGHERAIDHFVFESRQTGQSWRLVPIFTGIRWNEVAGLKSEVVCWIPLSIPTEKEITSMWVSRSHPRVRLHQASVDSETSDETQCKTSSLISESGTATDVEMASCVNETPSRSLASSPEETTQTSVQERPEGVQRWQAEEQCSVQPQHRERNPASLTQQTVQSAMTWLSSQMWTCSQSRQDRGHEQVEEGCGSTALYSSYPRNRGTLSSVCEAGALVPSPPCLGEGPHGWVPVDNHSTPVPSSTGEAVVGGLYSIRAQWTTGTRATRTSFHWNRCVLNDDLFSLVTWFWYIG